MSGFDEPTSPGRPRRLTKSQYLKGRQCLRRLWLAHRGQAEPEVEPDDVRDEREEEGKEVERFAAELFRVAPFADEKLEEDGRDEGVVQEHVHQTLMAIGGRTLVQQAWLATDALLAIVDILEPLEVGWRLWEVKASTRARPINDWDLGFQWAVARRADIDVREVGLVLLNKEFVRGRSIPLASNLLTMADRTAAVTSLLYTIEAEIAAQLALCRTSTMPVERPAARCSGDRDAKAGNRPSDCGHLTRSGVCGRDLPENWVGQLPNLRGKKAATLFAMERPAIEELELGGATDWTADQERCIRAVHTDMPVVDAAALAAELRKLVWPVAYIDFEFDTGMAVPRFEGCRPYDRIPFQWSMLVQPAPNAKVVEQDPFLHLDHDDPREPFARALLERLPATGSIVAHHAAAEVEVLRQLAERLGGDLAAGLPALKARFFDTKKLARAGYCHPAMKGSWSLKAIGPALLGRGYEDLAIQNGVAAVVAWKALLRERDPVVRERLRSELLAYCGRDTVLMHEIVESLRQLATIGLQA